MIQNKKTFVLRGLAVGLVLCSTLPAARADRIWWDGSRDAENAPPGKLLSDNEGYWGESVLTGVEYLYETPLTTPAGITGDDPKRFGRRLFDGIPQGAWNVPVDAATGPLAVVLDFKRVCTFSEVDIVTQSNKVALKIELADSVAGPWRAVLDRPIEQSPDKSFHRVPLAARPSGRLMRLTLNAVAEQATQLNEVLAWGDAADTEKAPEAYNSVLPTPVLNGIGFDSVPGITKSSFSDAQYWSWQRTIGAAAKKPAVWSQVATWDNITNAPILPAPNRIARPVSVTMSRNETENAALALTNTSLVDPSVVEVSLGAFRRLAADGRTPAASAAANISGRLSVAGAIGTRYFGTNLGPLLNAENTLGDSLMQRYLTNGAGIKDFPRLTLSPGGSAVVWIGVDTRGAAPGVYQAQLSYKSAAGHKTPGSGSVAVRVQVLDVTLPNPYHWLQTWSGTTSMFPFVYGDRAQREVAYRQSLGANVWEGLPTPGSIQELARKNGQAIFQVFILPGDYVNRGYNNQMKASDLTAKDEELITAHVRAMVKQTQDLGLTYDDWQGELWDEPGSGNGQLLGALARIVRKADPKVRIYVNPSFWAGQGAQGDEFVYPTLGPWYRDLVDVSVPFEGLLIDRPKSYPLFDAPREVRALYTVTTHVTKGEQAQHMERHRRLAWEAARRGWNGWGFFAYYRPEANPWNDFDANVPDYTMVYPGVRGPIPTRQSESLREGWEDYRLLNLLQTRGMKTELAAIFKAYENGESPANLRLRALRAAARR